MKLAEFKTHKTISNWLEQISQAIGIKLNLREDGHIELACSDKATITIEVSEEHGLVYFYSNLITLPHNSDNREPFYRRALELNAFNFATGGASISLDPRHDNITLTFVEKVTGMNADIFANLLNHFITLTIELIDNKALEPDSNISDKKHVNAFNRHHKII
ncbi:CesT family type III secretion system chaperone [Shewanella surugensis]|uniref:CesT family type III secretion system chaperone n=1 Tax=Shewanella surugensis TaxID=212020 RepID=A0ABT0LJS9_9GAMM|nr:CesT family type III secretion system chaperone [Shewanella surugensis]MCL1127710.1 CesT family type III secretion system chaperone [Shewanella surugensis]